MKRDKKDYLIIALIIIIILLGIILVIVKSKRIDAKDPLATKLYSYLGSNDLEVCEGLISYSDALVKYDNIKPTTRICMAYSVLDKKETTTMKLDKEKKQNVCKMGENITFATDNYENDICTVTKIEASKINSIYQEIYGKEIESYDKFNLNSATICYYNENNYYCGLSENFTYTIGAEPHTYRSIKKIEEKKDNIVIYDYFLKVVDNTCYQNYNGTTKNDKCSKKYKENKVNYQFLKKYGTEYKHTYKKNGENYYWVNSEPVK